MPQQPPWTNIGSLQSDVIKIQSELRSKVNAYEVVSLNSRVDALVNAVRDISTVCDGILSRQEAYEEKLQEIQQRIENLEQPLT